METRREIKQKLRNFVENIGCQLEKLHFQQILPIFALFLFEFLLNVQSILVAKEHPQCGPETHTTSTKEFKHVRKNPFLKIF